MHETERLDKREGMEGWSVNVQLWGWRFGNCFHPVGTWDSGMLKLWPAIPPRP